MGSIKCMGHGDPLETTGCHVSPRKRRTLLRRGRAWKDCADSATGLEAQLLPRLTQRKAAWHCAGMLRNFGAGLGYRYVDYGLNGDNAKFRGEVSYRFRGPTIYLEAVL